MYIILYEIMIPFLKFYCEKNQKAIGYISHASPIINHKNKCYNYQIHKNINIGIPI